MQQTDRQKDNSTHSHPFSLNERKGKKESFDPKKGRKRQTSDSCAHKRRQQAATKKTNKNFRVRMETRKATSGTAKETLPLFMCAHLFWRDRNNARLKTNPSAFIHSNGLPFSITSFSPSIVLEREREPKIEDGRQRHTL